MHRLSAVEDVHDAGARECERRGQVMRLISQIEEDT